MWTWARNVQIGLDAETMQNGCDAVERAEKGQNYLGIYLLDGDTLKWCVSTPDNEWPTEFTIRPTTFCQSESPKSARQQSGGSDRVPLRSLTTAARHRSSSGACLSSTGTPDCARFPHVLSQADGTTCDCHRGPDW